ncbi:hypothetical protein [Nocardia pseudovaccinii]|uniref:hypothetical protein n=1 Tax=Nocardia pseudovaccinii TaxID=189540 RepID=UPI0007A44145|nr:hypothetical protein [Nocardia pseudovaccinii]
MSRHTTLLLIGLVAIAIVTTTVTAIVLTNPDGTEHNPSTAPTPSSSPNLTTTATTLPPAPSPAAEAAEDSARQGLAVAYTWYPQTDSGPRDGFVRARQWMSATLAQRILTDVHAERGPGIEWGRWAGDGAKIVADVAIGCSGCPPDTDTVIHRVATIRQTAINGNHAVAVEPDTIVWVTMAKVADRWLIDTIRY